MNFKGARSIHVGGGSPFAVKVNADFHVSGRPLSRSGSSSIPELRCIYSWDNKDIPNGARTRMYFKVVFKFSIQNGKVEIEDINQDQQLFFDVKYSNMFDVLFNYYEGRGLLTEGKTPQSLFIEMVPAVYDEIGQYMWTLMKPEHKLLMTKGGKELIKQAMGHLGGYKIKLKHIQYLIIDKLLNGNQRNVMDIMSSASPFMVGGCGIIYRDSFSLESDKPMDVEYEVFVDFDAQYHYGKEIDKPCKEDIQYIIYFRVAKQNRDFDSIFYYNQDFMGGVYEQIGQRFWNVCQEYQGNNEYMIDVKDCPYSNYVTYGHQFREGHGQHFFFHRARTREVLLMTSSIEDVANDNIEGIKFALTGYHLEIFDDICSCIRKIYRVGKMRKEMLNGEAKVYSDKLNINLPFVGLPRIPMSSYFAMNVGHHEGNENFDYFYVIIMCYYYFLLTYYQLNDTAMRMIEKIEEMAGGLSNQMILCALFGLSVSTMKVEPEMRRYLYQFHKFHDFTWYIPLGGKANYSLYEQTFLKRSLPPKKKWYQRPLVPDDDRNIENFIINKLLPSAHTDDFPMKFEEWVSLIND